MLSKADILSIYLGNLVSVQDYRIKCFPKKEKKYSSGYTIASAGSL